MSVKGHLLEIFGYCFFKGKCETDLDLALGTQERRLMGSSARELGVRAAARFV